MTNTLQNSQNGFALPAFKELDSEIRVSQEAQLSQDIRSFYLMANAVVSKVAEIEDENKRLVLVVDDEPLTFRLVDEFLQEANLDCQILTATNGQKAYDIAVSVVPDLIITDWLIPAINGLELIKQLKANPITADIPMIMITGVMAPFEELDKAVKSGALDFVRKPLDYAEFINGVKAALVLDESLKEVKHQKNDLQIKNQFVNFLVDGAPNPIFYQDKWGRFLGCNKNFERLVNTNIEQILGRMADEFLPPRVADTLETHFASLRECGDIQKFEIEMPLDQSRKHLILSYVGLGSSSIEIVIGSITDITEIVQSGKETLTQMENIPQKEKEQFATNVEKLKTGT